MLNKYLMMGFLLLIYSQAKSGEVVIDIDGIEDLGPSAQYEGWIEVEGNLVSIGQFTVNAAGNLSQQSFTVPDAHIEAATEFVLTIEMVSDPDTGPSNSRYMAGPIVNGQADLGIGHPSAIGDDLTASIGQFVLGNLIGGKGGSGYSGIWYQIFGGFPGLNLPMLPAGWQYEGWVYDQSNDEVISTGTFTQIDVPDSDGAGALAGAGPFPSAPGQDFELVARDLTENHQAFFTVEPVPDNGDWPFTLLPLTKSIEDTTITQVMNNVALVNNPTGQVSLGIQGSGPVIYQVDMLGQIQKITLMLFMLILGALAIRKYEFGP